MSDKKTSRMEWISSLRVRSNWGKKLCPWSWIVYISDWELIGIPSQKPTWGGSLGRVLRREQKKKKTDLDSRQRHHLHKLATLSRVLGIVFRVTRLEISGKRYHRASSQIQVAAFQLHHLCQTMTNQTTIHQCTEYQELLQPKLKIGDLK